MSQEEVRAQLKEFEESRKQMEEDGDREIQDVRVRYERWLIEEREANLKMKGDTGIVKKKFSSLQKEVDDKNMQMDRMRGEQTRLQAVIKSLEKDTLTLKKEIQERDDTIQDKERRMYDLKKKNQELEKFKFVLDYKIKELRKQIEPRENDIKEMSEQIQDMEKELGTFHKENIKQELENRELSVKLTASEKELHKERQRVWDGLALIKRFKTDLHNCVAFIQEPLRLKLAIKDLHDRYIHQSDMVELAGIDSGIKMEYARQQEHLEKSVASLKKKLTRANLGHSAENVKIMQENVTLITEINNLRRELKLTRSQVYNYETQLGLNKKQKQQASEVKGTPTPRSDPPEVIQRLELHNEAETIIQLQNLEILRLRQEIQDMSMRKISYRPPSTSKLPALSKL